MADKQINQFDPIPVDNTQSVIVQAGSGVPDSLTGRWEIPTFVTWLKNPVGGDFLTRTDADGLYSPVGHDHASLYAPLAHVGAGGTAHALAVSGGAHGFMSGPDKAKLDGLDSGNYAPISHVGATGAAHGVVGASNGFMSVADKNKLDGLDGASYAPISHVGSTGLAQHGLVTGSVAGFMSPADKTKLDAAGIPPIHVAMSDQTSELSTGLKLTTYAPYAMTVTEILIGLATPDSGAVVSVLVSVNGVNISTTTAPAIAIGDNTNDGDGHTIDNPAIAKYDKLEFSIFATGTVGRGLTCALIG